MPYLRSDINRRWSILDTILGILSCCYRGVIPATIVKVTVVQWSKTSRVAQLRWRCHNLWTVGNVIVCPGTLALVHCWCNWHVCYFISALPTTTGAIDRNAFSHSWFRIHCDACRKPTSRANPLHPHTTYHIIHSWQLRHTQYGLRKTTHRMFGLRSFTNLK